MCIRDRCKTPACTATGNGHPVELVAQFFGCCNHIGHGGFDLFRLAVYAVSYTHLDVYKRQAYFKANNITKLPSPKKLEAEYARLASEKAKFYEQYKEAKEELLKLKTAKQNVASFFREEEPAQQER